MRRKKIKPPKKNKETIRRYIKSINILEFFGDTNIKIICVKCKETITIRSHHPELYTEEVRKNYVCLICEGKNREKNEE